MDPDADIARPARSEAGERPLEGEAAGGTGGMPFRRPQDARTRRRSIPRGMVYRQPPLLAWLPWWLAGVGACAPALAWTLAGGGWGGGVATVLGAGLGAGVGHLLRLGHRRDYEDPLGTAMSVITDLRLGSTTARTEVTGAPVVAALSHAINQALTTIDERDRRSQASLMSVEMAFERIHSVLQSLKEGVVLVDDLGEVQLANRAARKLIDRALAERGRLDDEMYRVLEGQPLVDLLEGEMRERVDAALGDLSDGLEDLRLIDVVAGDHVYDVSMVRVHTSRNERSFGAALVIVDVTRNHEVARLKDEFLSCVSHELRTPLTNVLSFTEILASMGGPQAAPEDWEEFAGIVHQEAQRLKVLVDQVLEYSNVESGRTSMEIERVGLSELLRGTVESHRPRAHEREVGLELDVVDANLEASSDRRRIAQVLGNLLDNALKFTPSGGHVRVTARWCEDRERCEILVEDSGPGVPEEHREAVFEKFRQLGDTLTEKPSGTGMGLALSRLILGRLDGLIGCETSELGGACFRVTLPRRWTTVQDSSARLPAVIL